MGAFCFWEEELAMLLRPSRGQCRRSPWAAGPLALRHRRSNCATARVLDTTSNPFNPPGP
jgi:hypothetical protein